MHPTVCRMRPLRRHMRPFDKCMRPSASVCAPQSAVCAPYASICAPQPAVYARSNPDHPTWQRCGSHHGQSKSRFTPSKVNKTLTFIERTRTLSNMTDERMDETDAQTTLPPDKEIFKYIQAYLSIFKVFLFKNIQRICPICLVCTRCNGHDHLPDSLHTSSMTTLILMGEHVQLSHQSTVWLGRLLWEVICILLWSYRDSSSLVEEKRVFNP
jgi:hypothetical protein